MNYLRLPCPRMASFYESTGQGCGWVGGSEGVQNVLPLLQSRTVLILAPELPLGEVQFSALFFVHCADITVQQLPLLKCTPFTHSADLEGPPKEISSATSVHKSWRMFPREVTKDRSLINHDKKVLPKILCAFSHHFLVSIGLNKPFEYYLEA